MDEYITIKELAEERLVSKTAIYKKIYSGELTAKRIGRQYLILKETAQGVQFRRKKRINKANVIQKAVSKVVKEHAEVFKMLGED